MTQRSQRFANAAAELEGTPFRLHGRNKEFGLDCIGLALIALKAVGQTMPEMPDYRLRNLSIGDPRSLAAQAGFERFAGEVEAGDLLLVKPGPAQFHFLIALGDDRYVHSDASLRRVATMRGPLRWPIMDQFRLLKER